MPISILHSKPSAVLHVEGEDALSFLQGQFTQDLKPASPGRSAYGLWLNQKGKIVGDSVALCLGPNEFLLVSEHTPVERLRERLEAYLVADDVVLEDQTAAWKLLTLVGTEVTSSPWFAGALARVQPGSFAAAEAGYFFTSSATPPGAVQALLPAGASESPEGAAVLEQAGYEALLVQAGVPQVGRDLDERDLPNEAGLEAVAISYTKGCYLGQEVMARLKSMGQVRRNLIRLRGRGAPPAPGAEVVFNGRVAGELRSAVASGSDWVGFAMVSLVVWDRTSALTVAGADVHSFA